MSQRLALKYNTTPRGACQHFLTSFFQILCGGVNALSQSLTALPAPSEREPLAYPQTLYFSRKLYRHAKGPILEDDFPRSGGRCRAATKRGICRRRRLGEFRQAPLPSCRFASSHLPQGDGFRGGGKVSGIAQRRPLGGAGCERSEQTEGVQPQSSPLRGGWHRAAMTGGVFPAASSPHPPPKALRIGGGCAIIYYIHYRALRKEP